MRKQLLAVLVAVVITMAMVAPAQAAGGCAIFRTWTTGNSLTAPDLNSSFATVGQTNMVPACMQSQGTSAALLQQTTDPYPNQVVSLPGTMGDELKMLRFVIQQLTGGTFWYTHTDARTFGPTPPTNAPTDQAGNALTLFGGQGTGTGVGGSIILRLAYPDGTGTAVNPLTTVMTLSAANNASSGVAAMAAHTPIINQSGTAGYTALQVNVTETAIGSGVNLLADLQTGAVSKFQVTRTGNILASLGAAGGATIATFTSAPITAARVYTFPDITGIVALTNGGQTFTSATWNGSIIGTLYGGTGINTSATTTGSLLYTSGVGTWTTLTAGSSGTSLMMGSTIPAWNHNSPLMAAVFN